MTSSSIAEAAVSHEEFAEFLESQIQRRLGGQVRDLHVLLREDGVILQGRSATYHAKQLAQHAAMELAGVHVLANDIEVC
jgi:hypothetical protein